MMIEPHKRRSSDAQIHAMRRAWPDFEGRKHADGTLVWSGPLQPKAQVYGVLVIWNARSLKLPVVVICNPPIEPRSGASYEDIPHLMFDRKVPERSGLCLFDPAGGEWSDTDLIADTTMLWAAEWLMYYELWHLTGEWLAPGVGYESMARMPREEARAIKDIIRNVH